MRKLIALAAMLAMMLVAAAPAMAQTIDQSSTDSSTTVTVTNTQDAVLLQDASTNVSVTQSQSGDVGGDQIALGSGDVAQINEVQFGDVTVTGAQAQQGVNQVAAGNDAFGAFLAATGSFGF
ncbi:MAG: hypothetical protein H0V53_01705 [Rubrobacter sp.]|nr:hypothetical protein [Rubrobacter sp.]